MDYKRPKSENPKFSTITYKGIEIEIKAKEDLGFYWKASYKDNGKEIYVNKESKKEALAAIKQKIDM